MTQEPTCIVDVIEIVPPEDVPVVAARVAERLAMPVERVQKLIDARTGPITRPLRPDKAEAIAQTFEAAGVVVAIRPATEDDDVFEAPPPHSEEDADEAEADTEEATERAEAAGMPTRTPPPRDPEPEPADLPGDESDPEPAEAPGYEPEPEPVEVPEDDEPVREPGFGEAGGPARAGSEAEGLAAEDREAEGSAPGGGDVGGREPVGRDPSDRDPRVRGPYDRGADDREPYDFEPHDPSGQDPQRPDPRPTEPWQAPRSVSRFAAAPRAPATLRIEPDDADDEDGPDDEGLEARGEIPPRRRSLVVEVGEDVPRPEGDAPSFTDESTWDAGDDSGSGWSVPRRGEADESGAILVDDPVIDPGVPEHAPRPMAGRGIGRRSRTRAEEDVARPVEEVSDLGGGRTIGDRGDVDRDERRDDDGWDDADDDQDEVAASRSRPVPVAWRGLGDEESGPARPIDANVPRRLDPEEERAEREAQRTILRRTLMLWALVLAVALFAVAQFWASGRAATGYDQGLDRFRDGQFAAARQVWSRLATAGDANAQFMLGYMSEVGMGQAWSARAAASWYRLAADQGHAEAQWRLANLHDRGLGVPRSSAEARRFWAAAADGGHAEAAFALGRSLFTAASTAADLDAAGVAFERAVALGWPDAAAYHRLLSDVSDGPNESALR